MIFVRRFAAKDGINNVRNVELVLRYKKTRRMKYSMNPIATFTAFVFLATIMLLGCNGKKQLVQKPDDKAPETVVPQEPVCNNIYELSEWEEMKTLVMNEKGRRLTKYGYLEDRWAYLIQLDTGSKLYDCYGDYICGTKEDGQECLNTISGLGNARIIWVKK